jgi:peroxiredoxin
MLPVSSEASLVRLPAARKRAAKYRTHMKTPNVLVASLMLLGCRQSSSPLDPKLGIENEQALSDLQMREQNNHPVTDQMWKDAKSLNTVEAPEFSLKDTEGNQVSVTSLTNGKKPLLIFFIERQCPCCLGAKYFVDKYVDLYGDKISVIGVINANHDQALLWKKGTKPRFRIVEDPYQKAIQLYKAERGVYTALIKPDGTIYKAYPGYDIKMLQEISGKLAEFAEVPAKEYISPAAPKVTTSGCTFPEPEIEPKKELSK